MFTSAKAWLKFPRHSCFLSCEVDADYLAASTETLVETYAGQILNDKSTVSSSNEVVEACKMLIRALEWLRVRKKMRSWEDPAWLRGVQTIPSHITNLLSNMFSDPSFLDDRLQISLIQRSFTVRMRLHELKGGN